MLQKLLFVGLIAACSKAEVTVDSGTTATDSAATESDTAPDADTARDTSPPESNAPEIRTCDASCSLHETGENYWQWVLDCRVTDPDGVKNIWNGSTVVTQNNNAITEYRIACNTDASEAICTTSFAEKLDNILCSQASSYSFAVTIQDWDKNNSKPFTVIGRQQ
jgi:hypothetical protein